jgi:hypothetical protein
MSGHGARQRTGETANSYAKTAGRDESTRTDKWVRQEAGPENAKTDK